jgi:hypothetical protein
MVHTDRPSWMPQQFEANWKDAIDAANQDPAFIIIATVKPEGSDN